MTAQLRRDKVVLNHKRVIRMMRKMGIQGRIKHQYITTTNSKHNNKIYSNLIKDKEYIKILKDNGIRISMSEKGIPYDNDIALIIL